MLITRADSRVLGYLGRALSLELTAVRLHTAQVRLPGIRGLVEESSRFREEAEEELVQRKAQVTSHGARAGDQDNRVSFESLHRDVKSHAQHLTQWLKSLNNRHAYVFSACPIKGDPR